MPQARPKYLNLMQIRLPVPGFVSILHRVSGAALFLLIPFLLVLFEASLASPKSFARFKLLFGYWPIKLIVIGLVWAYLHHLCAGVRHLALDLHYGTSLPVARATSWAVLALSLAGTLVIAVMMW